jgi:hypothetical protein
MSARNGRSAGVRKEGWVDVVPVQSAKVEIYHVVSYDLAVLMKVQLVVPSPSI